MAWTTPITAVANSTFTATQWNAGVRDNLAVQAAAISTTRGWMVVSDAANSIAQREVKQDFNDASGTTTSTTFTPTLTGGGTTPTVTIIAGAILSWVSANINVATGTALCGLSIDGVDPTTGRCIMVEDAGSRDDRMGVTQAILNQTVTSRTYTIEYRVTAGTGTFVNRRLIVMGVS